MAARRLLIVMLVLLGISSLIAIVVPKPDRTSPTQQESAVTGETGASGETAETAGAGRSGTTGATGRSRDPGRDDSTVDAVATDPDVVTRTVDLEARKPAVIRAEAGTRMILIVKSKDGSEVEIQGLGLAAFADPYAPAVFDLILPPDPGRFQVKTPAGKTPSATIISSS